MDEYFINTLNICKVLLPLVMSTMTRGNNTLLYKTLLYHFLSYIKDINISELGSMQTADFTSQHQLLLFNVNYSLIMLTLWPRSPHLVWQASWWWGPVR